MCFSQAYVSAAKWPWQVCTFGGGMQDALLVAGEHCSMPGRKIRVAEWPTAGRRQGAGRFVSSLCWMVFQGVNSLVTPGPLDLHLQSAGMVTNSINEKSWAI